jgi:hypothetical protein
MQDYVLLKLYPDGFHSSKLGQATLCLRALIDQQSNGTVQFYGIQTLYGPEPHVIRLGGLDIYRAWRLLV